MHKSWWESHKKCSLQQVFGGLQGLVFRVLQHKSACLAMPENEEQCLRLNNQNATASCERVHLHCPSVQLWTGNTAQEARSYIDKSGLCVVTVLLILCFQMLWLLIGRHVWQQPDVTVCLSWWCFVFWLCFCTCRMVSVLLQACSNVLSRPAGKQCRSSHHDKHCWTSAQCNRCCQSELPARGCTSAKWEICYGSVRAWLAVLKANLYWGTSIHMSWVKVQQALVPHRQQQASISNKTLILIHSSSGWMNQISLSFSWIVMDLFATNTFISNTPHHCLYIRTAVNTIAYDARACLGDGCEGVVPRVPEYV